MFLSKKIIGYFSDLFSLFYPDLCAACTNSLFKNEEVICSKCRIELPYTSLHLQRENEMTKLFWGRVPVAFAAACFYFKKGSKVQHLMYQLKYNRKKEVGVTVGKWYGYQLSSSEFFMDVDVIIPVPLHQAKLRKRGFNQAAAFAQGLSMGMNKPVDEKSLQRTTYTETQTRKSRFSRYKNVNEVFQISGEENIRGKHILLVDDVITTGSTLEACTEVLLKVKEVRISIATMAIA